jgi:hypothetical protein
MKSYFSLIDHFTVGDQRFYLQNVFSGLPLIEGVLSILLPNGRPIVIPEKGKITPVPKQGRFSNTFNSPFYYISPYNFNPFSKSVPHESFTYMFGENGTVKKISNGVALLPGMEIA